MDTSVTNGHYLLKFIPIFLYISQFFLTFCSQESELVLGLDSVHILKTKNCCHNMMAMLSTKDLYNHHLILKQEYVIRKKLISVLLSNTPCTILN